MNEMKTDRLNCAIHFQELNRCNVGIIVKFSSKKNPHTEFVVANTHLVYNPRRDDVRIAQMQVLLAELNSVAIDSNTNEPIPIILMGDFNCEPFSLPWRLINNGSIDAQNTLFRIGITDNCTHLRYENTLVSVA